MSAANLMQELSSHLDSAAEAEAPREVLEHAEAFDERLARAVVDGEEVDEDALEEMVLVFYERVQERADRSEFAVVKAVGGAASNVLSYRQHRQVGLPDGRVACEDGWSYENVEPGRRVPGRDF